MKFFRTPIQKNMCKCPSYVTQIALAALTNAFFGINGAACRFILSFSFYFIIIQNVFFLEMLRSSTSQNVPSPLVHNLLNEKMLKDVNKYLSSIVSAKVVVSQSDQLVWLV